MKPSGIEWIGEIPDDWEVTKLKYISNEFIKGTGITREEIVQNGDTPCVRYGDIYTKYKYIFSNCETRTNKSSLQNLKYFSYGDVLFTCTGELIEEIGKSIAYLGNEQCLAGGDILVMKHSQNPKFLGFALDSFYTQNQKSFGKAKLKVVHISSHEIENLLIILPPPAKQQKIAEFLDAKCQKIDSLSGNLNAQIGLLEEYKKSLITECVTGKIMPHGFEPANAVSLKSDFKGRPLGLPNPRGNKTKDSGVEWIGQIPEHWETRRISQLYTERRTKVSDKDFPPLSVTMKGIVPQLETAAKSDAHDDRKLVLKGDFAINSRSDRRGSCGISNFDGSVSLINTVLTPLENMNPVYYNWLFHTSIFADEFYKNGHGIVDDLWTTSWQEMKRISIPLPPLAEQSAIADYLDSKCAKIDSAISSKRLQLEKLEEYKKSLIFEYVTGKKEVTSAY